MRTPLRKGLETSKTFTSSGEGEGWRMYAKLYGRITRSSLMEESIPTRYCFVMLLAIADKDGNVIGTDVAIARQLNVDMDTFHAAIKVLSAPDIDSNSKECEGRRIVPSEGERGYRIVNYLTYRNIRDEENRRTYMREYMAEYRKRGSASGVTPESTRKPPLAHADAEASSRVQRESQSPPAPPQGGSGLASPTPKTRAKPKPSPANPNLPSEDEKHRLLGPAFEALNKAEP